MEPATSIWGATLIEFVDNVASLKPVPGGGAVAALSGCLGASLLKMLLLMREKEGAKEEGQLALAENARAELQRCAEEDIQAFHSFMGARRMPKGTEPERSARSEAIAAALRRCTEVPLSALRASLGLVPIAQHLMRVVPDKAISDFGAALAQIESALVGLFFTVNINLRDTASDPSFATLRAERDRLAGQMGSARGELADLLAQVTKTIGQS
jgi:glutamate formiminotransferase/formiminotetrahydrofolate cyclodeaminase